MTIKFNPCNPCCTDGCYILYNNYPTFQIPRVWNHVTGNGIIFTDYISSPVTLNDVVAMFFPNGSISATGLWFFNHGFEASEISAWLATGNKRIFINTLLGTPDKGDTWNIPEYVATNINSFLGLIGSQMTISTGIGFYNSSSYATRENNGASPFCNMTPVNPLATGHPLLENVRYLYSAKAAQVNANGPNCTYLDTTNHYARGVNRPSGHWLAVEDFGTSQVILCGDDYFFSEMQLDLDPNGPVPFDCDNYNFIYGNIYNINFVKNLLSTIPMNCSLNELPEGFNGRQQTLPYLSCYFNSSHDYFNIPWQVDRANASCEALPTYTVWENADVSSENFPIIQLYTIKDRIFSIIKLSTATGINSFGTYLEGNYYPYASGFGTITSGVPLIVNFSATTVAPPVGHQWLTYSTTPNNITYLPFRNLSEVGAPIGASLNWRFEEPTSDPVFHFNHPTQLSSVLEWGSGYQLMMFREGNLGAYSSSNTNSRAIISTSGGDSFCFNELSYPTLGYGAGNSSIDIDLNIYFSPSVAQCFYCEGADEFLHIGWSGGPYSINSNHLGNHSIQIRDPRRCDPSASLPDEVWIECLLLHDLFGNSVPCVPNKVRACLSGLTYPSWTQTEYPSPCSGCLECFFGLSFDLIGGVGTLGYCWCDFCNCTDAFNCASASGPAGCNPVSFTAWLPWYSCGGACGISGYGCSGLFTVYPA